VGHLGYFHNSTIVNSAARREDISNNKKDKAFLLVELRTASMYKCVTTQVESSLTDLYTSSLSVSHVNPCHFKVSVLVPLE
jgi:hypothetical protein